MGVPRNSNIGQGAHAVLTEAQEEHDAFEDLKNAIGEDNEPRRKTVDLRARTHGKKTRDQDDLLDEVAENDVAENDAVQESQGEQEA